MAHVSCPRVLLEHRRRRLILLREAYLRRLAVIPLEREVRRPHSEPASRDLLQIVVASLDPEFHGVEGILEADGNAHVVTIELLADGDRSHLHRRELSVLDFHWSAIEVVALQN